MTMHMIRQNRKTIALISSGGLYCGPFTALSYDIPARITDRQAI